MSKSRQTSYIFHSKRTILLRDNTSGKNQVSNLTFTSKFCQTPLEVKTTYSHSCIGILFCHTKTIFGASVVRIMAQLALFTICRLQYSFSQQNRFLSESIGIKFDIFLNIFGEYIWENPPITAFELQISATRPHTITVDTHQPFRSGLNWGTVAFVVCLS